MNKKAAIRDLPLRRCDPAIAKLTRDIPRLWRTRIVVDFPSVERTYVELRWVEGAHVRRGYLDTQTVLRVMLGDQPALPSEWIDNRMMLMLVADYCQQDEADDAVRTASIAGLVSGATLPTALYRLLTSPVGLLLADLPRTALSEPDPEALEVLAETLRWPLTLCLGRSLLPAGELKGLACGDVLLLSHPQGYARIPGKSLFYAQFNGEALEMTQTFDDDAEYESSLAPLDRIAAHELPVEIEFVLAERSYSLAQLCELEVGDVLELGAGAARHIQVRAGKQLLAEGELVALDEHLGVELTRVRLRG